MTALRKRTQAQRDAINARAAAVPRPLSVWQVEVLRAMAEQPLARRGAPAGWASGAGVAATITSLLKRGFCRPHMRRFAIITAAGKRELARHGGSS